MLTQKKFDRFILGVMSSYTRICEYDDKISYYNNDELCFVGRKVFHGAKLDFFFSSYFLKLLEEEFGHAATIPRCRVLFRNVICHLFELDDADVTIS